MPTHHQNGAHIGRAGRATRPRSMLIAAALLTTMLPLGAPSEAAAAPRCDGLRATIVGTDGADTIRGTARRDVIVAKGGDDKVFGLGGDDTVCAGAGDDDVRGGSGSDDLRGEGGNDDLFSDGGAHGFLIGGPGDDLL